MTELPDEALREDLSWVARMKKGDERAFAAFYDRHAGTFKGLAFSILGDAREAEDAVQDALVYLWKTVGHYDEKRSRPMTWAVMICRNKAIDHLRARGRRANTLDKLLTETAPDPFDDQTAGIAAVDAEQGAAVRAALQEMPPEQREAIVAAFFGGLSQAEISEKTRTPLGTVKARIRRGLLRLRQSLKGKL